MKKEEEKERKEEQPPAPEPEKAPEPPAEDEVAALRKQLEDLKKDVDRIADERDGWKNKYYLAYADMANTRKEVEKENAEFKRYARQSVIEEFIPVLDSFDMALKNEPDDPVLRKYLEGFQMIHKKLLGALTQLDVRIIDPQPGDEFDPHLMEAFSAVDGDEDNKVHETFLKGYRLHDHLLRAAGVVITKKKVEEMKEEPKEEKKNPSEETKTEEKAIPEEAK